MKKIPPKKITGKSTPEIPAAIKPKRKVNAAFQRNIDRAKAGECLNPKGRPKGSRNRFAEAFVSDFLKDWEEHGAETIGRVREEDPSTYVRVGVSIIPKDFNISSQNEANLTRLLEQFDEQGLDNFIKGIEELGARCQLGEDEE